MEHLQNGIARIRVRHEHHLAANPLSTPFLCCGYFLKGFGYLNLQILQTEVFAKENIREFDKVIACQYFGFDAHSALYELT